MPRWKQQLGGVLFLVLGGGFTFWTWQTALTEGHDYLHASLFFPAVCVMGLGMLLFPGYKEERLARGEDISGLSGSQLLTPRWWAVLVIALFAGVVNLILLRLR